MCSDLFSFFSTRLVSDRSSSVTKKVSRGLHSIHFVTMFAVMVAGRLPQVDFQNIDSNKFLVTIPDADSINFLVVFMTGTVPFPAGE